MFESGSAVPNAAKSTPASPATAAVAGSAPATEAAEPCARCLKRPELCVCSLLQELPAKHVVLILQHPQEPDQDLGSARIAHLSLPGSVLKIGLSWPNLKSALGREALPSRWAVLYLGSGIQGGPAHKPPAPGKEPKLQLVNNKGAPLPESAKLLAQLEGIVVLDGTWSQAKTLWWRNAWLLKLQRAVLIPGAPSLYKELRKEPRPECLSTIETIAQSLRALGEPKLVSDGLTRIFGGLLDLERKRRLAAPRKPKTDWRRRRRHRPGR